MAQYLPPTYQPPIPENRSRASSNASMSRYHPDNYRSSSPPPPPDPAGYPVTSRPRGPSLAGQQVPSKPPMPQMGSYGPQPAGMVDPQGRLHPGYPDVQPAQPFPPNVDRDFNRRPSADQRRASASSTHSHRSHHSHRSGTSHRSGHSRRSSDYRDLDRRSNERDRDRKDRDRRHSDDRDHKPPKRVDSYRPSWGGTLFSMYDTIKSALGPRDKY